MKTFTAVLLAVIFLASVSAMTVQEQRQMMIGVATDCKSKTGANDNDLSLLILKKPMTTHEGKCLMFCIMEGMGVMDAATRTLKKDEFIEYISIPAKGDQALIGKLSAIAEKCALITDDDSCEMAFKSAACIKTAMAAQKIKTDIGI
ncbi:hypothetical protein ACKWTF_008751 [Chironomus riparius]